MLTAGQILMFGMKIESPTKFIYVLVAFTTLDGYSDGRCRYYHQSSMCCVTATHCVVSLQHIVLCHCDTLCCVTAAHCVVSLCLFCGAQQHTGNHQHNWLGRLAQNRLFHGTVVCLLSGVNSMQILLEI